MKIFIFPLILLTFNSFIYRKLFDKTDIPETFQDFINHEQGICVYLIFDDYDRIYKINKDKKFSKQSDYFSAEKIVKELKGEKVFEERWPEFIENVERIKKDSKCLKKMIFTYESFFSELK